MALDTTGNATASMLYHPYGTTRSSSGSMPGSYGFAGQHSDAAPSGASGLDYFNARYFDAETGRFTSADDAQPGLGDPSGMDNYAYVGGMVEQATDPSGQSQCAEVECLDRGAKGASKSDDGGDGGGGDGSGERPQSSVPAPPPTSR